MSEEEIDVFLERAIHDLRAAARAIGLAAEMGFGSVPESIGRMNRILEGMASYANARRTSGYAQEEVSTSFALLAATQSLREVKVESGDLPVVLGDEQRIVELFRILIQNAITYRSADDPCISFNAVDDGDFWLFAASDNGIGVEAKYREQIFLPFHRLHGEGLPGVGLGLAIARRIVEGHGGTIWFSDEKTVSFRLPKA